jgi:POT family proton-dependent oligopeptide transporter
VAGYLAQRVDWHVGFAAAGVGMTFGLVQYIVGKKHLRPALDRLATTSASPRRADAVGSASSGSASSASASMPAPTSGLLGFTQREWMRIGAIFVFFLVAILFWGAYEQAGSTLNLFADRYTRLEMFGVSFPSSWFQSVSGIFVIILAPIFAWVWISLGPREPSVPAKIALGLFFLGVSFLVLVPAGQMAQAATGVRVSPWWLIVSYMLSEFGELCLSPVGISAVTKLAPVRIVGLMMGVWFLSNAFGNKLAGWAAGFFSTTPLVTLFSTVTAILMLTALVMFALVKPMRRLMGESQIPAAEIRTRTGT